MLLGGHINLLHLGILFQGEVILLHGIIHLHCNKGKCSGFKTMSIPNNMTDGLGVLYCRSMAGLNENAGSKHSFKGSSCVPHTF